MTVSNSAVPQAREQHAYWVFGLAILLSGFAALSYQVVWQRALTQAIESDAISVVLVVTIFMVWLGVGSALARKLISRSRRSIALIYVGIEVAPSKSRYLDLATQATIGLHVQ